MSSKYSRYGHSTKKAWRLDIRWERYGSLSGEMVLRLNDISSTLHARYGTPLLMFPMFS
jgi:hypothetical protein